VTKYTISYGDRGIGKNTAFFGFSTGRYSDILYYQKIIITVMTYNKT
jgi:hypothetical protein